MATKKQKKAIAILAENVGIPVGEAMLQAGYKKNTSLTPQRLTESKAFKSLVEALPDDLLAKVHLEGLQATKRSGTGGMKIGLGADGQVKDFGHTEIDEPDYGVRHKYLDSAYKLKGSYAPEKSITLTVKAEPNDRLKKLAEKLNQSI